MFTPKVSVITVVYNGESSVKQTIDSVLAQSYGNIEYIIIDGGSTDQTVDVIRPYQNKLDCFMSEIDDGIADAMNKGVANSNGEYLIFLHADDYFFDDCAVEQAVYRLEPGLDLLACSIQFGHSKGRKVLSPRGFSPWLNVKNGIHHQGAICSRKMFDLLDGFNSVYRIAMDYDFFLRAYQSGVQCKKSSLLLSVMNDSGISSQTDTRALLMRMNEEKKVHYANTANSFWRVFYLVWWYFYPKYKLLITRLSI